MIVTIVTVYHDSSEHYVGVVAGQITEEQRDELAAGYDCHRTNEENDEDEEPFDMIFFREIEVVSLSDFKEVKNIDGENYPGTPEDK